MDIGTVFVTDIPEGFGLYQLKTLIAKRLMNNDDLLTIQWVTSLDGTRLMAELQFKNRQCTQRLVNKGSIPAIVNGEQHFLMVTEGVTTARLHEEESLTLQDPDTTEKDPKNEMEESIPGHANRTSWAELSQITHEHKNPISRDMIYENTEPIHQNIGPGSSFCDEIIPPTNKPPPVDRELKPPKYQHPNVPTTTSTSSDQQLVSEFNEILDYKKDIIMFVEKSSNGIDQLAIALEDVAQCEIIKIVTNKKTGFGIKYKPNIQTIHDHLKHDQKKFEAKCKKESRIFFEKYVSRSENYNQDNLSSLKKENAWSESEHIVQMVDIDAEVYVRWEFRHPGYVTATGIEADVTRFLTYLKTKKKTKNYDITEEEVYFSKQTYRALQECNMIHQIEIAMNKSVTLTPIWEDNGEKCVVMLRGPSSFVKKEKKNLTTVQKSLKTHQLSKSDNLTKFLLTSLENEARRLAKVQQNVRQKVQNKFKDEEIYASLQLRNGDVCLVFVKNEHRDRALEVLNSVVKEEAIELDQGNDDLVNSPEWRLHRIEIDAGGTTKIFSNMSRSRTSIVVVGLWDEVQSNVGKVNEFFDKNKVISTEVEALPVVIQFFEKYLSLLKDYKVNTKDVELTFSTGKIRAIAAKGKREHLQTALDWIENCKSQVEVSVKQLQEPGIPAYFRTEKGREEIELIANGNMCIGIVDPAAETYQPSSEEERKIMQETLHQYSDITVVVGPTDSSVKLKLVIDDITQVNCEAIVNTSNKVLELRNGGISGSILKKGGPNIQKEMEQVRKKIGGQLSPGNAVSTSAGNLPMKRIIHTAGPRWIPHGVSRSSKYLRASVLNCMEEASKHQLWSLAIPAISCGVFGGDPEVCVPIIVQTAVEFIKLHSDTSLKEIVFVERSNKSIISEFRTALQQIKNDTTRIFQTTTAASKVSGPGRSIKSSLEITLTTGNIIESKSDVIVTSTTSHSLASGQGSAISKCLVKALGSEYQSSCAAAAQSNPDLQPGDVVSTPVVNQSYSSIFHVVLSNYDASTGEDVIRKTLNRCLAKADEDCHNSIAFPCLGSGGFGFPADKVADWMDDAVRSFKAKYLQKAFVVILPTDKHVMLAFQHQLDTTKHSPSQLHVPHNSSIIDVAVIQGSITSAKSDVIVNSTLHFDLTGQVGKVLTEKGGQTIAQECANSPLYSSARLRITGAGTLPYQHIYHLDVPKDLNLLEAALLELFMEADKRDVRSLAMPAVGTGNIGLPVQAVAKCIRKCIDKFEQTKPRALREISIHVFESTMVATFQEEMAKSTETTENVSTAEAPHMGQMMTKPKIRNARQSADSVALLFCSLPDNVNKAWQTLHAKVDDMSLVKTIESNTLQDLSAAEKELIMAEIRKRNVTIEATTDKITLRGLKVDVLESHAEALGAINRYNDVITCAEYVTWNYEDSATQKWGLFERLANYKLENAYKEDEKGSKTITAVVKGKQRTYKVNFDKMNQTCSNGAVAKVKRVLFSDVLPDDWEHMGDEDVKKVELSPTSPEYQIVLAHFNQTLKIKVIKIERIQNPTVYKMFHVKKQKTTDRMLVENSKNPVARRLFHGTAAISCENIYKGNFDRGFAGAHATLYGHGIYFATTASYTNQYAAGDTKHIFLAEVITGEYCKGDSQMRVAPMQPNGCPFDSVVNNVSNPTMFVVFKDASVYPSYLVTYTPET